mmetsp:Transcript_6275/g.11382  ORF Transcript_6275/g.11382 Transcript_6275/m.11382 type:complete len:389 (-) Transcript_6275:227-1393(-)
MNGATLDARHGRPPLNKQIIGGNISNLRPLELLRDAKFSNYLSAGVAPRSLSHPIHRPNAELVGGSGKKACNASPTVSTTNTQGVTKVSPMADPVFNEEGGNLLVVAGRGKPRHKRLVGCYLTHQRPLRWVRHVGSQVPGLQGHVAAAAHQRVGVVGEAAAIHGVVMTKQLLENGAVGEVPDDDQVVQTTGHEEHSVVAEIYAHNLVSVPVHRVDHVAVKRVPQLNCLVARAASHAPLVVTECHLIDTSRVAVILSSRVLQKSPYQATTLLCQKKIIVIVDQGVVSVTVVAVLKSRQRCKVVSPDVTGALAPQIENITLFQARLGRQADYVVVRELSVRFQVFQFFSFLGILIAPIIDIIFIIIVAFDTGVGCVFILTAFIGIAVSVL